MTDISHLLPVPPCGNADLGDARELASTIDAPDTVAMRPETLHQALTLVERQVMLPEDRLRCVRSDCVVAARLMGQKLDKLPCDPVLLRPILKRVLPARHRMTLSRWKSVKSSIARVLKLVGWHESDAVLQAELSADWERGRRQLPKKPQKAVFGALARYCDARGIAPSVTTEATLEGWRNWRLTRTLDLNVGHGVSALRRHWNFLCRTDPAWPARPLIAPADPRCYGQTIDQFAPTFADELTAVLDGMATFRPLDERATRTYGRLTITGTRGTLLRAASVLQLKGDAITSLYDVLKPASVKSVLLDHFERNAKDNEWPPSSVTLAITLCRTARLSGLLSAEEMQEVSGLRKLVRRKARGMSAKVRDRLAQFDDPRTLRRLFDLPDKIFAAAAKSMHDGHPVKAAWLSQRALALAILFAKPLRVENLVVINLERHFRRDARGRLLSIRIPGAETKSGRDIEVMLDRRLAQRITTHVKTYRPLLPGSESSALFPGGAEGHIAATTIARNLRRLIANEVGAAFNPHLVRHLVATMAYADDSRNGPVAQRMLDHGHLKTTERYYGHARTRGAQREWGDILHRRLTRLRRRGDR